MSFEDDVTSSKLEPMASLDYVALKREIEAHGPLRISRNNNPYQVIIEAGKCECAEDGCTSELVLVWRVSGLFKMNWLLSKEEFEKYQNLDELAESVVHGHLQDSRAERLVIERQVSKEFNERYEDVHPVVCSCKDCLANFGEKALTDRIILANLAHMLNMRDELLNDAAEWDEENSSSVVNANDDEPRTEESGRLYDWVFDAIELGYALGRSFSEYAVKNRIEPLALIGMHAEAIKKKREIAAGKTSSESRNNRRADLLEKIEALVSRSPDIVRIGPDQLAKVALEDCINDNRALWRQGKGQVNEYLDEIRRGDEGVMPEMQERYQAIFGRKPLKRSR